MYYVGAIVCDPNYLAHHGIKGQKWGVRRFQNEDGSLTPAGKERYDRWQADGEKNRDRLLSGRSAFEKRMQKLAYENGNDDEFAGDVPFWDNDDKWQMKTKFKFKSKNATQKLKGMHSKYANDPELADLAKKAEEARNSRYKSLFGVKEREKAYEEAEKVYSEFSKKKLNEFLGESYDYIDTLPVEDRDAAAAYIYDLMGYWW